MKNIHALIVLFTGNGGDLLHLIIVGFELTALIYLYLSGGESLYCQVRPKVLDVVSNRFCIFIQSIVCHEIFFLENKLSGIKDTFGLSHAIVFCMDPCGSLEV